MRSLLWILVTGALVVGGCGGDEPQAEADASPAASKEEPEPEETPDPKADIRERVSAWLEATAGRDGKELCAQLAPSERRHFDKRTGSCAKAFAATATPKAAAIAKESKAGLITVYEDGYATIEIDDVDSGRHMTLYAIEEDGDWWLARKKRTGLKG